MLKAGAGAFIKGRGSEIGTVKNMAPLPSKKASDEVADSENTRSFISRSMSIESEIADRLDEVAQAMGNIASGDAKDFIAGVDEIRQKSEESNNKHVQLQGYILDTIVDDMWLNVAMTSSIYIHDDVLENILMKASEPIAKISDAYERREYTDGYLHLAQLYDDYTEMIKVLNEEIDKAVKRSES